MKDLSFRLGKPILPKGLPAHLLLESGGESFEMRALAVQIVSVPERDESSSPAMKIERFPLPAEHFAVAYRVDTTQMNSGEYVAVVVGANQDIEWEESFWVLDCNSYQQMLDDIQDDVFDDQLRIRRADLLLLLRRKLIEAGDETLFPDAPGPLAERDIPSLTKTSASFVTGGALPISTVNFGFDRLLDDFMYLNIFSAPVSAAQRPGQERSITLKVNETGDLSVDAEAFLAAPLPFDSIKMFIEHSAVAQASQRWPDFFDSNLTITPKYFRLHLTIAQNLRGRSNSSERVMPAEGAAQTPAEISKRLWQEEQELELATAAAPPDEFEPI